VGENEKMKIESGKHNRIIANTFRGISAIRYIEGLGWWPATGSESFTMLEPGRGYRVMAEDDCVWRHEKNTVEIAFAEFKAQELSKSFWAGIQRMSAEDGRYKSTGINRR